MRIFRAIVAALFGAVFGFLFLGVLICLVLGYLGNLVFDRFVDVEAQRSLGLCLIIVATVGSAWFCANAVLKDSKPIEDGIRSGKVRESPEWLKHKMSSCRPDE